MNSKELNEKIAKICDDTKLYEAFGGKSIPYIGWYWRTVNFDSKDYHFGILPYEGTLDDNDIVKVGFMENNKWDYHYIYCPPEKWKKIKTLLEIAVTKPTTNKLRKLDKEIQSLLEDK